MIDKLLITCLQRNKRLVLPGLGAFIRKSIDGVGVVLVFVPFLNKDDGVLLNAFKEWAGVDGDDARQMLEEYVGHIKQSLAKRGLYIIEGIGVLKYDLNGSLYLAKEGDTKRTYEEQAEPIKKELFTTEETKKQEEHINSVSSTIEELAASARQINSIEVTEDKSEPVFKGNEETSTIQPESVQFPQAETATEDIYGTGINSRFASQQMPQENLNTQIPPVAPVEIPREQEVQQPAEPQRAAEQPPIQTYRTVSPQQHSQPQRRPGNVGAVYFSTNDEPSVKEQQLVAQQPEIENASQQSVNNTYRPPVTHGQQRPMTSQQRNSALYGTQQQERRPLQPQQGGTYRPGQQQQPIGQQRTQPVIQKKRPVAVSKSKDNSFSTKLVWILAIVAIALTLAVMVYAFIYSEDIELYDEITVEQPITDIPPTE